MSINSIERLNYKLINLTNVLYFIIRFDINLKLNILFSVLNSEQCIS